MRSVQVSKANGPLEIVERDIPEPSARQVRIKVQACGVCHSDSFTKKDYFQASNIEKSRNKRGILLPPNLGCPFRHRIFSDLLVTN